MRRCLTPLAALSVVLASTSFASALAPATTVAICNFKALKSDAATDWIGTGIHDAITADLSKALSISLRDISKEIENADQAVAVIRRDSIDVVVYGQFQVASDEVRATGKVLSASGKQIAFLSAKAPLKEIFRLQDELAKQVRDALVHEPADSGTGSATQPTDGSGTQPVPFPGSLLERALADEAAGRKPADGTGNHRSNDVAPSRETPSGWAGGGTGVGITGGYNPYSPYYVPYNYPPRNPPRNPPPNKSGGASGGSGSAGGANGGGATGGGTAGGGTTGGTASGGTGSGGSSPPASTPKNVNPFDPKTPGNSPPPK